MSLARPHYGRVAILGCVLLAFARVVSASECGQELDATQVATSTVPIGLDVLDDADGHGLLVVEEQGTDVVLRRERDGASTTYDLPPSGWAYQPLRVRLGDRVYLDSDEKAAGPPKVRVRFLCGASIEGDGALVALERASQGLARSVDAAVAAPAREQAAHDALAQLEVIAAQSEQHSSSPWPWLQPMALQSSAFLLGRKGDAVGSMEKLRLAILAWESAGDVYRSLIARHRHAQQARRQGLTAEAEVALRQILDALPSDDPSGLRGMVANDLCLTLRTAQRLAESSACYADALAIHQRSGDKSEHANTLANLASLRLVQGRFAEADHLARDAIALAAANGAVRAGMSGEIVAGGVARAAGDTREAVRAYLRAEKLAVAAGDRNFRLNVSLQLANTWFLANDFSRARAAAEDAARGYSEGGYWRRASQAMLLLAELDARSGQPDEARARIQRASAMLAEKLPGESPVEPALALAENALASGQHASARAVLANEGLNDPRDDWPYPWRMRHGLLLAALALESDDPRRASTLVYQVRNTATKHGDPFFALDADILQARIHRQTGDVASQVRELESAITRLVALARAQGYPVYRSLYAARALELLEDYLPASIALHPDAAFDRLALLERVRSLGDPALHAWLPLKEGADVAHARATVNEALRRHWLADPEGESAGQLEALASALATLETAVERPADEASDSLARNPVAGERWFSLFLGERHAYAWRHDGVRLFERQIQGVTIDRTARALHGLLLDPNSDPEVIARLGKLLREPLGLAEGALDTDASWRIVLDGALVDVPPWAWLGPDGPSVVIQSSLISRRVSAAGRPCCNGFSVAAFADPAAATELPTAQARRAPLTRLPGSRREVAALRRSWPGPVEVRTGADFTAEAVRLALGTPDSILHLATHGLRHTQSVGLNALLVVDPDNGGRLDVLGWNDVIGERVEASLVVLGACDAGAGASIGRQTLGLAHAFLAGGAPTVVAPLWQVDDEASVELMRAFYAGLAEGLTPERALSRALRAMDSSPRFSHPHYRGGIGVFQ